MEYVTLNNGVKMPILGFGTYFPTHDYTEESIYNALCLGYRMLDTAKWYNNEELVGRAIMRSGVNRKELFITSKLQCGSFDETINNVNDSLKKIGTDYFDLILVHWPTNDFLETYKALEYLYDKGIAKSIGISNFNEKLCTYLLSVCRIKPQVNQIEANIYFQENKMYNYLKRVGVQFEGWATFCEGYCDMLKDETLISIGNKYNKSAAQVALRFFIQKGVIVLPRSHDVNHIRENLEVFDFNLSDEDLKSIENLDKKRQYSGWPQTMLEETYY